MLSTIPRDVVGYAISYMDEQTAFNNPFYNRDLLGLIMRACSLIGPITMSRLGAACRLAYAVLQSDQLCNAFTSLQQTSLRVRETPHLFVSPTYYELWIEYAIAGHYNKHIPRWVRDDYYYARVLPYRGREVFNIAHPTEEQYAMACGQDGKILLDIPKRKRTRRVVLAALGQNGMMLQHCKQDHENIQAACRQNGNALAIVEKPYHACMIESVRQNGMALVHVPNHKRSGVICIEAVKQNPAAFAYVPKRVVAEKPEIYVYAARDPDTLLTFPRAEITMVRVIDALSKYIHNTIRHYELNCYIQKLEQKNIHVNVEAWTLLYENGMRLCDIYFENRSVDACQAAVMRCESEWKRVPTEHKKIVGLLTKKVPIY